MCRHLKLVAASSGSFTCGATESINLFQTFSTIDIKMYHSKRAAEENAAVQFNSAHQLRSPNHHIGWWLRFEIRTLADTFQSYYYCYWTEHSWYCPDCSGILDIVQIDKAGWVSSQYSKNCATRPMRTDARTVTGGCRIGRRGDHTATCGTGRCSSKPFCVPFSTSCVGFGT